MFSICIDNVTGYVHLHRYNLKYLEKSGNLMGLESGHPESNGPSGSESVPVPL